LPEEREQFAEFVGALQAAGGGDDPEHGLEALALAIKSEWGTTGAKRREIVALWTDTGAHPLEKAAAAPPPHYPRDLPPSFDQLSDLWETQPGMRATPKRLILFAPDAAPWNVIENTWRNVIQHQARAGEGLADTDLHTILATLANSI